jgi:hypothetical protein
VKVTSDEVTVAVKLTTPKGNTSPGTDGTLGDTWYAVTVMPGVDASKRIG